MTTKAGTQTEATEHHIQGGTWVYDRDLDCMVEKRRGRNYFPQHDLRADHLACPAIRPDGMSKAIKSMADGRVYDGKSAYYRSVQRAGAEIVGFDKDWQRHIPKPGLTDKEHLASVVTDTKAAIEIEQSKVPSYGPEARRLMRKQRRRERASK